MKKFSILSVFLLLLTIGCNSNNDQQNDSAQKQIVSDHAHLEEAKAISKKLFEGLEKVDKKKLTREEFEGISKPLQKQLNILIISLEDEELQELEKYRNKLMMQIAEKKHELENQKFE